MAGGMGVANSASAYRALKEKGAKSLVRSPRSKRVGQNSSWTENEPRRQWMSYKSRIPR